MYKNNFKKRGPQKNIHLELFKNIILIIQNTFSFIKNIYKLPGNIII